jgi:hypothetical protein
MPIYSRRYDLWTRLYNRMLLEPTGDATVSPMVSEVVVPVISADTILSTPTNSPTVSKDLSATAGSPVNFFTVPLLEEWNLIIANRGGTSSNSRAVLSIGGNEIQLTTYSTSDAIIDLRNFTLRANDTLSLYTTGNAADSSRVMRVAYHLVDLST